MSAGHFVLAVIVLLCLFGAFPPGLPAAEPITPLSVANQSRATAPSLIENVQGGSACREVCVKNAAQLSRPW